jgi:hypothetical protein
MAGANASVAANVAAAMAMVGMVSRINLSRVEPLEVHGSKADAKRIWNRRSAAFER